MRTSHAPDQPQAITREGYRVVRRGGRFDVFPRAALAGVFGRDGGRDALVEIWNGVPWMSPLWVRGPRTIWLHHVHGPMWKQVLPSPIAQVGELVERSIAPRFYRRERLITLSESSKAEMVHGQGFRAEQVAVIPPGIHERFRPDPAVAKSPTPLVVGVGRLMPVKQFDTLIRTVAGIRTQVPGVKLLIVGDGEERSRLDAVVDSLDAGDMVEFAGRLTDDELVDVYRRAWVLSSASVAEGWGMTITEAAACGTPAVVTDIGGHRDAVSRDVSGLLADPDDLGRSLARVLTDDVLRRQLAQGALDHARRFSWDATAYATFDELARRVRPAR